MKTAANARQNLDLEEARALRLARQRQRKEYARRLLAEGMTIPTIRQRTGLGEGTIRALKREVSR